MREINADDLFGANGQSLDDGDSAICAADSERAILGALMLDPSAFDAVVNLGSTAFFLPSHQQIYAVISSLHDRGITVDPIQIVEELRSRGKLDDIGGGPAYISTMTDGAVRIDIAGHVARVIECAEKRELQRLGDWVWNAAANGTAPAEIVRQVIERARAVTAAKSGPLVADVQMSGVERQPIYWLWHQRIPCRALTIVEGAEGLGKSTLLCDLAASITRGDGLPETPRTTPANVLWLSAEDDLSHVLKARLETAGADCERVFAIGDAFRFDQRGMLALEERIAERSPALVIIDPIFAYTEGDANKGCDARKVTGHLRVLAERYDCAIVLVRHIGKAKGLGDPRAAGLYSIEWRAAARSVLLVGANPNDEDDRAITQSKNNFGRKAKALKYKIVNAPDTPAGAVFQWDGESDLTPEKLLAQKDQVTVEGEAEDAADAERFLRETLLPGPVDSVEVRAGARATGITDYRLRQAQRTLGVIVRKEGGRFGKKEGDKTDKAAKQKWTWSLPQSDSPAPEDGESSPEDVAHLESRHLQEGDGKKINNGNNLAEGVENSEFRHLQQDFSAEDVENSEFRHLLLTSQKQSTYDALLPEDVETQNVRGNFDTFNTFSEDAEAF